MMYVKWLKYSNIFTKSILSIVILLGLSGCISPVLTGVSMIYNRHNTYKTIDDVVLAARIGHVLAKDKILKCSGCALDVAVFNRDVLLVGHLPTTDLRIEALSRVNAQSGYRRVFNQIYVGAPQNVDYSDSLITAKIMTNIVANSKIDPHKFKVVTFDNIVYLMGDVELDQAKQVINIASTCSGVKRVVTLFKYYHFLEVKKA